MNIPFSPPDITEAEIQEVAEALRSGWITTGPRTKAFESKIAEYCHTEKAVCLNSATACMELTLRLLGIGEGDEVITSAYTYTASASVIEHVGAKIVLVDTAPDSYEMDYEQMEAAITERTKVIIPIDIAGVMCDYDRIFRAIERKKDLFTAGEDRHACWMTFTDKADAKNGIPINPIQKALGRITVIADAAHAFGGMRQGKMCGEAADFTSFSFHAVKNLTTAEGGAVVWKDIPGIDNDQVYKIFQLLSLHGQSKDALSKMQLGAWEYDIIGTWQKCNMTDVMAAIGLVQFERYQQILKRRQEIIERYTEALKKLPVQVLAHKGENYQSSGHLYLVRLLGKDVEFRNQLIIKMAEAGVATNVHYKPLPMHTAYRRMGFDIKDYPNAEKQYCNEITLPLHTCLTDEQVEYVAETFVRVYQELENE